MRRGALFATRLLVGVGLLCIGASASAEAVSACDNFFGQRCVIGLPSGVHMSYFELGDPAGQTLILLHTDTTSAVEWAWTVAALLARDPHLHVYALDQRGAGFTELPETAGCWKHPNACMAVTELAADVLAFMNAERIDRAVLVGHALGAGVARNVALNHAERVEKLILSGMGPPAVRAAVSAGPPTLGVPLDAGAVPSAVAPARSDGLEPLGWRAMVEAKGVKWPTGALHMRPIDIDPEAVLHLEQHWDISVIAAPDVVAAIAAQTAAESLATWQRLDSVPVPSAAAERLEQLSVPTLVLWGSEDAGLDRASQERVIASLRAAARTYQGMYFYWKQYGIRPRPASGDKHDADDIGHNLSWEAPEGLAADIDSFVRTGAPTRDRYSADAPAHLHHILVEPGAAILVTSREAR